MPQILHKNADYLTHTQKSMDVEAKPNPELKKSKGNWGDDRENFEDRKTRQVSENNTKYGEWWVEHLGKKSSSVMFIVSKGERVSVGKKMWAKNAVRVKLYNSMNSLMEEHSLADIVYAHMRACSPPFPDKEVDTKNQVNSLGTYYMAAAIYKFLQNKWVELENKRGEDENNPVMDTHEIQENLETLYVD